MKQEEKYSFLTKAINILVAILLIIAIFYMVILSDNSYLPMLFSLIAFTIASIPEILKKKKSG
ncbi:hypothetical protein [Staphylococcus gallinarum]|uniref:hypothetical protein n=2 Tax=Staphylococcus TaxID=1279 RepID=UPI002174EAE8|nr:hypothetical protein [Staphylococcus gallinarum]